MLNLLKRIRGIDESTPELVISPAMAALVAGMHYELVPMKSIEPAIEELPPGAHVSLTCSPAKGIPATQQYTELIRQFGHHPVPHLAARLVESREQAAELAAWLRANQIEEVFVIAGDAPDPAGPYEGALAFIRDLLAADPGVSRVGVAGYPDGHGMMDASEVSAHLHAKQALLAEAGVGGWVSTQMCFDDVTIRSWIETERAAGLTLPIRLGVPGVVDRTRLMTMGTRLGIGASLRFLAKNRSTVMNLMAPGGYDPTDLVVAFADEADRLGIEALHSFTFNAVADTRGMAGVDPGGGRVNPVARIDAIVIGAGVIGSSVALELARGGRNVVVVDKGPGAGAGSTSASSSIIRYSYSTRDAILTAWEAAQMWFDWERHLGTVDPDGMARFIECGNLILRTTGYDGTAITPWWDEFDIPYEDLDAAQLQSRFPTLDIGRYYPPKRIDDPAFADDAVDQLSALYSPNCGFIDDPMLSAKNLAYAARQHGADFRFRSQVVSIDRSDEAVSGVTLASGESLSAPIVVNVGGPHANIINQMADVTDDMTIGHRALRQEVFTAPAPIGLRLEDGAPFVSDLDVGQYFRPQVGGTLLIGGSEPECDELHWVDDPDSNSEYPTVEVWETAMMRAGPPRARVRGALTADRAGGAVRRVRRLGTDLRPLQPARLLHGVRHQRQPVQECADRRSVHA